MKCRTTCMFCEEPKTFFINPSKFHGVCLQHCAFSSPIYRCSQCKAVTPIVPRHCETCKTESSLLSVFPAASPYFPSNEDSYVLSLKQAACGSLQCSACIKHHQEYCETCRPSSFKCLVCNIEKGRNQDLPCNHSICAECFNYYEYCVECEQSKPKSLCEICHSSESVTLMRDCGTHQICATCFSRSGNRCTACVGVFTCQNCLNQKYFRASLECHHMVCLECEKSHVCYKCQVCSNENEVFSMHSCQHLVCKTCYEKSFNTCTICTGELLCQICNTSGYFRSTLICGHVVCPNCADHHQCFKCEVCGSGKHVKLRKVCDKHYVCKECFKKSNKKCTVCEGTVQCPSCNQVKYFPRVLDCGHLLCSDCGSSHSCFTCENCGNVRNYQLPDNCEKHQICNECYENAGSVCVKCSHSFTCIRCKHIRFKKASCFHDFCTNCAGVFLCPYCKEDQEKKSNRPSLNEVIAANSSKLVVKPDSEHFSVNRDDTEIEIDEDQTSLSNAIEKPQEKRKEVVVSSEKPAKENLDLGVIPIENYNDQNPLLEKPESIRKKLDPCSCSFKFLLLIILYIMTLMYCFGCFCNFCFGYAKKENRKRFQSWFCLDCCDSNGLYRKIWKHLVRFKWAS